MYEMIEIQFEDTSFPVYHSKPDGADMPGLIIIHEVWGLTDHIKDVADRFAKEGYDVLAPDLLSHTGITEKIDQNIMREIMNPETRSEAQKKMRAAMTPLQEPGFAEETVAKLMLCVTRLLATSRTVGVVGYCFGGTYAFSLAASDNRLKAAVPYYGHAPEDPDKIKQITCPVLAFYGEKDTGLMGGLEDLKQMMAKYSKDFTPVVYPDAGHAFFNDTNPVTYNAKVARNAWQKTTTFLSKNL